MEVLRDEIGTLQRYVIDHLASVLLIVIVIIGIAGAVMYLTFSDSEAQLIVFMNQIQELSAENGFYGMKVQGFWEAFFNNLKYVSLITISGTIPFLFAPGIMIVGYATLIAISAAYYHVMGITLHVFLLDLLAKGMFSIPLYMIASTLGIRLCMQITKKVLGKNQAWHCKKELLLMGKVIVYIVVPLCALVAVLEVYVSPMIIRSFL